MCFCLIVTVYWSTDYLAYSNTIYFLFLHWLRPVHRFQIVAISLNFKRVFRTGYPTPAHRLLFSTEIFEEVVTTTIGKFDFSDFIQYLWSTFWDIYYLNKVFMWLLDTPSQWYLWLSSFYKWEMQTLNWIFNTDTSTNIERI